MRHGKNRGATKKSPQETPQQRKTPIKGEKKKSATAAKPVTHSSIKTWLLHHKLALTNALNRIKHSPIPSFLTVLVVGVALALPAALQVIVKNVESGQQALGTQNQITLFLKTETESGAVNALLEELKRHPGISQVKHITAAQAWDEFRQTKGLQGAGALLNNNPLPDSIVVQARNENQTPEKLELLNKELQALATVDVSKIDMLWIQRLHAIVDFMKYTSLTISIFLIFTVLIVIGNTIKTLGHNFHDEIIVSKLVGANDGYVRRPFLYSGAIFGLGGAIFAIFFVSAGILLLTPQLDEITSLYHSELNIVSLNLSDILSLLLIGVTLGLGGAWISANRLISRMMV